MLMITAAVGEGARNLRSDVKAVQELLRRRGVDPGAIDGLMGPKTQAAIRRFQAGFLSRPDGVVDVGGTTWQHLAGEAPTPGAAAPSEAEWGGDSAQWPQEKKLASMNPALAAKVRLVLAALTKRSFQPKIFYGWRSQAVQARLFAEGKSKVKFSFHNAQKPDGTPNAYAADIIDARYGWSSQAETSGFWKALGDEANKQGLVWGGDWASFRDWAHVQLLPNSDLGRIKMESDL
jgi:peptidoglycan L-alanyl-D-glutamate endopeptidase CwlK